jgi:iron complex outermembrane receptor protein
MGDGMIKVLLTGSALWLTMIGQTAWAQADERADAPNASAAPVGSENSPAGLAEIVVTAQRREELAQRTGIAIDVLTGGRIVSQGVTQATDLSRIVPSLNVQAGGGASVSFFLRGVGNFTVNGYSDPALGFNYDGVYVGRPTSTSGVFYDLERVEVLKGPQGTLYGRNATAGAINIIPARPKPGQFSGSATASYGNYDALSLQGALNIPVSDTAAIRVAANVVNRDGYLSDGTSDEETQAVRAQFLAELTPELTVRFAGDWSHSGGKGVGSNYAGSFAFNRATNAYGFVPSGLDRKIGLLDPAAQAYRQTLFIGVSGRNAAPLEDDIYLNNDFYGLNAEVSYDAPIGTFTIIPAWRRAKLDNKFGVPAFIGWTQEDDEQFSLEARLAGKPIGPFDYILGAYYFDEKNDGNYTFGQQALNSYQDFQNRTKSWALFGRLTANLSERLRLIGGLRYTRDKKRFDGQADVFVVVCTARNAFGAPNCPTVPLLPVTDTFAELQPPYIIPPANQARPIGATGAILTHPVTTVNSGFSNGEVTWRAAAEFDVAERSLLYASVERGYRSGGFSLAAGRETYAPEFLTAYTVGMKNRLLNNRLQVNVEAFWWEYKDQQIGRVGVDARGNQGQFSQNIGQSTLKGIELETQFLALPSTLLSANVQYLDSEYDSFVYNEPVTATGAPPLSGCPANLAAGVYTIDCSGFPAFNAPKWTINLGAQQTLELGAHKLVGSVDTQYRSKRYVQVDFLPQELVGGTWTTNLQLAFGPRDDRWTIAAFVRNLENDRFVLNAPIFAPASSLQYITNTPRTYGLRASVNF